MGTDPKPRSRRLHIEAQPFMAEMASIQKKPKATSSQWLRVLSLSVAFIQGLAEILRIFAGK